MEFIGHTFSCLVSFNNRSLCASCSKFHPVSHCFPIYVVPPYALLFDYSHFCSDCNFSADEINLLFQTVCPSDNASALFISSPLVFIFFPPTLWSWQEFLFINETYLVAWLELLSSSDCNLDIMHEGNVCYILYKSELCCNAMVENEN